MKSMALWNWLLSALFVLQAHFAASHLVPLDSEAQREFGGLLRWVWPWSGGDSGLLGQVTVAEGGPLAGIFLAIISASFFFLAAFAVMDRWVPFGWWRLLAGGGAVLSLLLMVGFFGFTKVLPIALDIAVIWIAVSDGFQVTS